MNLKSLFKFAIFTALMALDCAAQGVPDLVCGVRYTGQASAGQILWVSMIETNIGSGPANGLRHYEFLLSSNTTVAGLVPNGAIEGYTYWGYNANIPVNGTNLIGPLKILLPDVPAGSYYLIGIINDQTNDLYESDYANNVSAAVPITVGVPDLVCGVRYTGQASAGQNLSVSMTETNIGNGFADGLWYYEFVLSTNTTVAGAVSNGIAEYSTSSSYGGPIAVNGTYLIGPLNIRLPDVPAGSYYLIGVDNDRTNDLYESSYDNNASAAVPITVNVPDLTVTNLAWTGIPTAGQILNVSWRVNNFGAGSALTAWFDRLTISTNATLAGAVCFQDFNTSNFNYTAPAGSGYNESQSIVMPNISAGTYYLIASANSQSNLWESNYGNNTESLAISIGNTDLAVTNFSLGATAIAGMNLPVSFSVINISTNAYSSYWYDGVTLSTNATLAGAIMSWDWNGYHSTTPGGGYVQNRVIPLPAVAAGTNYYLIAQVDDRMNVLDGNRANNYQVMQVTITNVPPTITLWTPTNIVQQTSCVPVCFTLSAGIQLGSYAVTNVIFYDGSTPIGQATASPYQTGSLRLDHGSHIIKVTAWDKYGLSATSTNVTTVSVLWPSQTNVLRADLLSNTCVVCMAALNGTNYVIETKTNLASPVWQPLATNQVTGGILVFTNQQTVPRRFYRTRY